MTWFDEQLRYRRQQDEENFSDALSSIAGAVMGTRLSETLDSRKAADSAVEEILRYYHCAEKNGPPEIMAEDPEERLEMRLRPFGLMHREVTLDSGWYRHAVGAMLGTLKEDGSAVALIPGRFSGYRCFDPRTGKWVRLNRRTEKLLEPQAICFYSSLPRRALKVMDLLQFMWAQLNLSDRILNYGMMLLSALLGMLTPKFNQWLFGEVLESGSLRMLMALAGFMISFSLCRLCFTVFQSLANARIGTKQNIAVQAAVMNRIMSLPAGFFQKYSPGELSQRASYVQSLCSTLTSTFGTVGLTSVFSLIYVRQIFEFAPSLVLPSILMTLATFALSVLTTLAQIRITRESMERSAVTSGLTYSTITGIQKIKLAGAEKRMFSRWARQYSRQASLEYNPPVFLKLSSTISLAVSLIGTMVLYWAAIKSGVSVANYYAFSSAYGMVSSAFTALSSAAITVAGIRPTLEMAKTIMEAEPEVSEGKEPVVNLRGDIELSGVSFRYDENLPNVIDNLSLKIKAGEYVAITGATGCGKSTLMRLLLGFEKPQRGSIYYDRKDTNSLDMRSLRRKIGSVMQNGKLFPGDIYSNIVISAPQLSLSDAWEAAEIAQIAEDIRSMPMGMNTYISEGQGGISGGQRQRLMIARAVAPKPKVLIFDEATSALDNVTQKKVSDAIDSLRCTRIVIAHRLSTIRHADRILFLEDGKIAEEGTYEELLAKNGSFAALVERQRADLDLD